MIQEIPLIIDIEIIRILRQSFAYKIDNIILNRKFKKELSYINSFFIGALAANKKSFGRNPRVFC